MTEIQSRVQELKTFQKYLFEFLDKKEQTDETYQNLSKLISSHNFNTNETEIKPFISIITNIHSNHHRSEGFNEKIFQILSLFLDILKQKNHYSNRSLFNMFKNDKRILLFLIEQEVLTIDEEIKEKILKNKYKNNNYYKYLIDNNKDLKSNIGENDNYICELIRNDSVDEFITYVNQKSIIVNNYSIESSIYETNSLLLKNKNTTLIEYAAFFGSIQIFNYLKLNGAELTPSLWIYSIHSNNPELIQILEDSKITPSDSSYKKCLKEAIKCHHNEIAEYIQSKFIKYQEDSILYALKYYNFEFYPSDFDVTDQNLFMCAIKHGHFYIVKYILAQKKIDINKTINYPYKNIEIDEDDEKTKSSDISNKNDKKPYDDWVRWNEWSKESREEDRIRVRKYYKSHYLKEDIAPLHLAVENEYTDIVDLLIHEPEINVNKILTRYYNIEERHYRELLDTKREEKIALHIAVEKNNLEIVKLLCSHPDIKFNAKTMNCYPSEDNTRESKTAIHIAIENNEVKIVEFLSHLSGIKINLKSTYERWWNGGKEEYEEKTPLNLAVEMGNQEICEILLSNPSINVNDELIEFYTTANLSYVHKRKETSLIIAIDKGYYNIVELLLNHKYIDFNTLSIKEYRYYKYTRKKQLITPLFLAIKNNDLPIIELLLSSNAIDIRQGLLNIGGGSNLAREHSIGYYNPRTRKDINKPKRPRDLRRLDYLNLRKDNYTDNGVFSRYKQIRNDERYIDRTEEEDIDDDFDFRYRIFKRMSPLELAIKIGNIKIKNILEKAPQNDNDNDEKEEEEEYFDRFDGRMNDFSDDNDDDYE